MDLPTYTNIWRIEKRLYKLYDFRLPMPLPINWIAVFAGITLPYVVLLIAIGLPFNHTLLWLYVLPPGLLTWLTTRPVIEGKRLPELVESQVRYLTEPRTWVRLTPLAEKDQMVLSARVWARSARRQTGPPRRWPPQRWPRPKALTGVGRRSPGTVPQARPSEGRGPCCRTERRAGSRSRPRPPAADESAAAPGQSAGSDASPGDAPEGARAWPRRWWPGNSRAARVPP